jgi:hypothetical protein
LPRLQQLVTEQQIAGNTGCTGNRVSDHTERVVDPLGDGVHGLSSGQVESDNVTLSLLVLKSSHYKQLDTELDKRFGAGKHTRVLNVETTVGGQGLGDDQEGIGECLDTHLRLTLDSLAEGFAGKVGVASNLESTGTGDN